MQRHCNFVLVAAAVIVGVSSLVAPAEAFSSPASLRSGRQNLQATRLCALEPRERTYESMKKSKANYLPRLKTGVTFYEGPLREAIDEGDWETVATAVKERGEAWKLAHVDKYASGVVGEVIELKGPLKVFASSITASDSESQATQKLYAYLTKYVEFNDSLAQAATAGDGDAALQAWRGGCVALRLYVETLNKEIPRSVGKISLPDPPYGKIEVKASSPTSDSPDEE